MIQKWISTAKRFQPYCTVAYLVFQCLSRLNRLSPTSILKKIDKTRQESAPSLYACLLAWWLMNWQFWGFNHQNQRTYCNFWKLFEKLVKKVISHSSSAYNSWWLDYTILEFHSSRLIICQPWKKLIKFLTCLLSRLDDSQIYNSRFSVI